MKGPGPAKPSPSEEMPLQDPAPRLARFYIRRAKREESGGVRQFFLACPGVMAFEPPPALLAPMETCWPLADTAPAPWPLVVILWACPLPPPFDAPLMLPPAADTMPAPWDLPLPLGM